MDYNCYVHDLRIVVQTILQKRQDCEHLLYFLRKYREQLPETLDKKSVKRSAKWLSEDLADLYTECLRRLRDAEFKHNERKLKYQEYK